MNQLIILNYHDVFQEQLPNITNRYAIPFSLFLEQLDLISEMNIPFTSISNWQEGKVLTDLCIALTFDDGYSSHYHIVYPTLRKRNIPATFFPITSKIGQAGFLSWFELEEMAQQNFEIGMHGNTHRKLSFLPLKHLLQEVHLPRQSMENISNPSPKYFALPNGVYTQKPLRVLAKANYKAVFTTRSIINTDSKSFLVHRYNIRGGDDIVCLRKILSLNQTILSKKKMRSKMAFVLNQMNSLLNVFR
jgi:peptidoglycan/xylan/chitin deacetylase (PgdA/CDA1 family)